MTSPRAAIIGAGLGGLTCAIALRETGIEVDVYEAANRIEETGAGLPLGCPPSAFMRQISCIK